MTKSTLVLALDAVVCGSTLRSVVVFVYYMNERGVVGARSRSCFVRLLAGVLIVCGVGACGHVPIRPAPPRTAPFAERVAYFREHRTARWTHFVYRGGGSANDRMTVIWLANGQLVVSPEALIPAVEPTSFTARVGFEIRAREQSRQRVLAVSGGVMGAGLAVLGLGYAIQGRVEPSVAIAGGVVSGVGALIGTIALLVNGPSNQQEEAAFAVYDDELRHRLGIRQRRRGRPAP